MACLLLPIAAMAKENKADTTYFPPIIISANKYAKNYYEIPLSITAIKAHQIQNNIGNGFDDALNSVPGLMSFTRSGTPDIKIIIRGFGARGAGDRSNSGTSRGIKFLLDGIPESEPDGRTSFDHFDMAFVQDVEVIRSNTSSLYGNAAAGIVSINTFPTLSNDYLKFDALGGSFGLQKYALSAFKRTDNGGLLGNASYSKYDGFRENSNSERFYSNFVFKGKLSDRTRFTTLLTGGYNQFGIPGPLTLEDYENSPEKANKAYLKQKEGRRNYTIRLGGIIDHDFSANSSLSATFYANPKYLERSERKTARQFTRYKVGGSLHYKHQYNITDAIQNAFIAGMDEQYQDGAILFYKLTEDAGRGALKTNKREGANTMGFFLQDELTFSKQFSLLFGGRYDVVSYFSDSYYEAGVDTLPPYEAKHFTHFSPKVAAMYNFSDYHSVYASYGTGIEVPAGNETSPSDEYPNLQVNPLLEPIISNTIELGTKQHLMLSRESNFNLDYDVAMFYINVENELVPYSNGKFYMSAGKTNRLGGEAAVGLSVFDAIFFNSSFTYMNSVYSDYVVDLGLIDSKDQGKFANYKDNKVAGVPEYFYNISLKGRLESLAYLFAEITLRGVSSYKSDDANRFEVPSYNLLNLTVGLDEYLKLIDGVQVRAYASINNLLDVKYASSSFINPRVDKKTGAAFFLEPGMPRNFVFGLSFKLD